MNRVLLVGTLQGVPRARHAAVVAAILPPTLDSSARLAVWGGKHLEAAAIEVWDGVVANAQTLLSDNAAVENLADLLDELGRDGLVTLRTPDRRVAMAKRLTGVAVETGAPEVFAWVVTGDEAPVRE